MSKIKIKKHFLTGVFSTLPLFATIYILYLGYKLIAGVVKILLPIDLITSIIIGVDDSLKSKISYIEFIVFVINILIFVVSVYLFGVIINKFINKGTSKYIDGIMNRIPIAKSIYSIAKQIIDTFVSREKSVEKKVVLVEYPRDGIYSLGFVASEENEITKETTQIDVVNIFIPSTPNPGNGFFIIVPKDKIVEVDYTYEEAFKLVMSAGALEPERGENNEKN